MENPFVTNGYAGESYFCDRQQETNDMVSLLTNGNNLALISPRRVGKTDLIRHCFAQSDIRNNYYTFVVDIYSTRSLADFVNRLGKIILDALKLQGKRKWSGFVNLLSSLQSGISYDANGIPSWTVSLGDIRNPNVTLDEIFKYLQQADKPCIVAIDEFQQITKYTDAGIEAALRTYVQYCSNAHFIFAGSQRHLMGTMFTSPARPFYQSVTVMNLPLIDIDTYTDFCQKHFSDAGKKIEKEVVHTLYEQFDGITFYLQKVMNILFMRTSVGDMCRVDDLQPAINYIVDFTSNTYEDLLYQLPEKQKMVLQAISAAGKAKNITSGGFARKYGLPSPSSSNSAIRGLLEKDLITSEKGIYQVYDKFFDIWLKRK